MSHIHSVDTKPERIIRSHLFKLGYRFRKNDKRLPGKPDIVFPHYHAVIFVNGCFWHGHKCYGANRFPKTNTFFWITKIQKNKLRDKKEIQELLVAGWRVGVVWECSIIGKNKKRKVENLCEEISLWLEEEFYETYKEF